MEAKEYDNLPQEVKAILDTYNEHKDAYKECERIIEELNKIGYTADYYLDGVLFDVKRIKKL